MAAYTDNFNRADNLTEMGANWTPPVAANPGGIYTNAARANGGGDPCQEYWNANTVANDQYAQCVLTSDIDNVSNLGMGPAIRIDDTATTDAQTDGYMILTNLVAAERWGLFKRVAGTNTRLGSWWTTTAPAAGDIARIEASGTTISAWRNGSSIISQTDSAVTSGRAGLFSHISGTASRVDDWEGGDLGAAADTTEYRPWRSVSEWRGGKTGGTHSIAISLQRGERG